MLAGIISIALIIFGLSLIVRSLPKFLLYALVAAALAIQFVAKKILIALPWLAAAVCAVTVGLFALGRQFFGEGDAKIFVENFLPPREVERETFSLALIELMIVAHQKILSRTAS